jgi:hypothetical protein
VWQAIVVSPEFHTLPAGIQLALVAHEEGHLRLHHCKWRLWWAVNLRWLWGPEGLSSDLKEQELLADAYCASLGLSHFMVAFLLKRGGQENKVRPSSAQRIARLRAG